MGCNEPKSVTTTTYVYKLDPYDLTTVPWPRSKPLTYNSQWSMTLNRPAAYDTRAYEFKSGLRPNDRLLHQSFDLNPMTLWLRDWPSRVGVGTYPWASPLPCGPTTTGCINTFGNGDNLQPHVYSGFRWCAALLNHRSTHILAKHNFKNTYHALHIIYARCMSWLNTLDITTHTLNESLRIHNTSLTHEQVAKYK